MRISELAARTGVPIPTIKYYLREGLLPAGERTSATQARYGDAHVERLRLVRALVEVAGLSIGRARQVLSVVDAPPASMLDLLHSATDPDCVGTTPRATRMLADLGWDVPEGLGAMADLERALDGVEAAGFALPVDQLRRIADGVDAIATAEIDGMPTDPAAATAYAVLGTELVAPIILALRRIGHARHSILRFAPGT